MHGADKKLMIKYRKFLFPVYWVMLEYFFAQAVGATILLTPSVQYCKI